MKHTASELSWILLSVGLLALLPWWQAVLCSAVLAPFVLRLTERGLKRRLVLLFIGFVILMLGFHASRPEIATAIAKLFRLPHYTLLAILSAGCFAVVFALAAESVLWMKFSVRRFGRALASKN